MKHKLLAFTAAVMAVSTIGLVQLTSKALDSTRDADKYAVVYNGTMSPRELKNAYDNGRTNSPDIPRIFSAMKIGRAALNGTFTEGVVHTDGTVTVGGKVVATNARTAIRNMSGGTKISGTNAAIYSTSAMGDDQTAMVKMVNNEFRFAVMKPCGNPVTATPKKPEKPEPKPSAKCDKLSIDTIGKHEYRYTADASVKNGATIKSYTFVTTRNGKQVDEKTTKSDHYTYATSTPGTYEVTLTAHTSVGNKSNQTSCVKSFTVKKTVKPESTTPAIEITKHVEGEKFKRVKVGVAFDYQIKVKNTGTTTLRNAVVTDSPEDGIELIDSPVGSIEGNIFTHTIKQMSPNEERLFTIQAKVTEYTPDTLKNKVCVDTEDIEGSRDACDSASVDVRKTDTTVTTTKDTEEYSDEETDEAMPEALPETGSMSSLLQVIGAASLSTSSIYYAKSRKLLK